MILNILNLIRTHFFTLCHIVSKREMCFTSHLKIYVARYIVEQWPRHSIVLCNNRGRISNTPLFVYFKFLDQKLPNALALGAFSMFDLRILTCKSYVTYSWYVSCNWYETRLRLILLVAIFHSFNVYCVLPRQWIYYFIYLRRFHFSFMSLKS